MKGGWSRVVRRSKREVVWLREERREEEGEEGEESCKCENDGQERGLSRRQTFVQHSSSSNKLQTSPCLSLLLRSLVLSHAGR